MGLDPKCLFCKIIEKTVSSDIVYETKNILAFKDVYPVAPIHYLIIPKDHIATINDIADEQIIIFSDMMLAAKELAKTTKIDESGYRLVMNCNQNGGQTVYHIHMHFLGNRQLNWPPG